MQVSSYKDLIAYQKSYSLVKVVYNLTKQFPKEEIYGVISQLRRASVSIPSNIAEGYMRGSKEYVQFLKISLGSCAEVDTLLSLSKDLEFCSSHRFEEAFSLNLEATKLIAHYIKKLKQR